jgi:hypothetical protein
MKLVVFILAAVFVIGGVAFAGDLCSDVKVDIGYNALLAEEGELPDGSGVGVTQVEAWVEPGLWYPNVDHSEFTGKTLNNNSTGGESWHATKVGRIFYGNESSMSPGISVVDSFWKDHWIEDFLNNGFLQPHPLSTTTRIGCHAYIQGASSGTLKRLDWLIAVDEFHQVVSTSNPSRPLWGDGFNSLAVGRSNGSDGLETSCFDFDYCYDRWRPNLVAPMSDVSWAVPLVASAVAVLVDKGHDDPGLSSDPVEQSTENRSGRTIYNAERSETVKAALMAGADRETENSSPNGDIVDYGMLPEQWSDNGLDRRYGAGQVNIYKSFHIIAAGEQNSLEDAGQECQVRDYGFDYDPSFGGLNGSNVQATYTVKARSYPTELAAALVWNMRINAGESSYFMEDAKFYDLNLLLLDITNPGDPVLVSQSASSLENTENIWFPLQNGRDYQIRVVPGSSQAAFDWDFALAWRVTPRVIGDFDGDDDVDGADMYRFIEDCTGEEPLAYCDTNEDGEVNAVDMAALGVVKSP